MSQWIDGSTPEDQDIFYWLTVKNGDSMRTYPMPCKYDAERGCWIDAENNGLPAQTVAAHYPICMPKAYSTIGSGCGFYIRTLYDDVEMVYGFRCQFASWVGYGYGTREKAVAAARRMRRVDRKENEERDKYEVLNSDGRVVWSSRKER